MMRKVIAGVLVLSAQAASAEELVIAALGDSLTQGYGLPAEQGFVPQLQGWLDMNDVDARLINAGVSGDTTAGGLARVEWTLTPDVDGLIVALGGNDLLRGLAPEQARTNIGGILQAAQEADVAVLLIGMAAPGNYGTEYKSRFDAIYPELATQYSTEYLPSFFDGLLPPDGTMDPAALRAYFQADGIHPNAVGVSRIVSSVGPQVKALVERIAKE